MSRSERRVRVAGRRHRARELALRVLFELEATGKDAGEALVYQADELGAGGDVLAFARTLVYGCLDAINAVDAAVAAASTNWSLTELGKVERAVLRLGAYELLFEPTPLEVAIDESVELAKAYAGDEAAGFVNGVLAQVVRQAV